MNDLDSAANELYSSLEKIRDLGLFVKESDQSEIQDSLNDIADRLGRDGEAVISEKANRMSLQFHSKYLNTVDHGESDDSRPKNTNRRRGDD